jgi:hypothetical protein
MAVFEVIYTVAATLWILVVVAALCIACRVMAKLRTRQRRINRLFGVLHVPIVIGKHGVLFLWLCERAGRRYSGHVQPLYRRRRRSIPW